MRKFLPSLVERKLLLSALLGGLAFFVAMGAIASFVQLMDAFRRVSDSYSVLEAIVSTLLYLPFQALQLGDIMIVLGVFVVCVQIAMQGELIALASAGVSRWQTFRWLGVLVFCLGIIFVWVNDQIAKPSRSIAQSYERLARADDQTASLVQAFKTHTKNYNQNLRNNLWASTENGFVFLHNLTSLESIKSAVRFDHSAADSENRTLAIANDPKLDLSGAWILDPEKTDAFTISTSEIQRDQEGKNWPNFYPLIAQPAYTELSYLSVSQLYHLHQVSSFLNPAQVFTPYLNTMLNQLFLPFAMLFYIAAIWSLCYGSIRSISGGVRNFFGMIFLLSFALVRVLFDQVGGFFGWPAPLGYAATIALAFLAYSFIVRMLDIK